MLPGGGKIPLLPNYVISHDEDKIVLRNFEYNIYEYPDNRDNSQLTDESMFMRKTREEENLISKKRELKIKIPVIHNT